MSTSSSPTTHDSDGFVCECEGRMRSACEGENFYKEHDGKRYCVLHYPGTEKKEDFKQALQRKLDAKDFDFRGVWFPEDVSFSDFTFGADANFSGAQFSAVAHFIKAKFSANAFFSAAKFSANAFFYAAEFSANAFFLGAQFSAVADFIGARFSVDTSFNKAKFSANAFFNVAEFSAVANFNSAQFSKIARFHFAVFNAPVKFQGTRFIEDSSHDNSAPSNKAIGTGDAAKSKAETIKVEFDGAIFKDGISLEENVFAEQVFMSFDTAIFEKPERATFHTTPLRPHWFINVDSRKFTFINVDWGNLDKRDAIRREIKALGESGYAYLSHLLENTFRQLAVNAEENNRYEEAANFRYMAMEVRRLQRGRKVDPFRLGWWYWLLSGYGERVTRAFGVLLTVWLLFAVIYWTGNATWWQPKQSTRLAAESSERENRSSAVTGNRQPITIAPLTIPEAIIYSAGVMSLQKPEPLPANKRAKSLVLFETILGPLQAALLALAIRRKFMR